MYHHGPQTLPGKRLNACHQLGDMSRLLCAVHGHSRRHRSQAAALGGCGSERATNVRRAALSLEADAPVIAAAAAAAAAPNGSGIGSRRRIRRIDNSGGSSSNGHATGRISNGFSSSSSSGLKIVSLSDSAEFADSGLTQAAAAAADQHNSAAAASTGSNMLPDPSAAAVAAASGNGKHAPWANGTPVRAAAASAEAADAASAAASAVAAGTSPGAETSTATFSLPSGPTHSDEDCIATAAASASTDSDEDDQEYAKQLQEELQQACCCQDVLDIVSDEASHFQPCHTVTALARLAKMSKGLAKPQQLQVLQDPGFIQLLGRLCQQCLAGLMSPFELSNALYSCGVLQVPLEHLKAGSSKEGSSGKAASALDALESLITTHAHSFNDRDVSSALYGYAQLRVRRQQSMAVIAALVSRAQSLIATDAFSPRCTSMTLWALATLFGNSSSSSTAAVSSGVPLHAFVGAAARQLAAESCDFDALGSQGVANSVWGAVKLGSRQEELLSKTVGWLAANIGRCKMQEVLNILWAAGACRHRPLQLGSIVAHVAQHAQALKPADIASLFHVVGIFGFDFSSKEDLLQQLLQRAQTLLPQMRPFELTSLFWGLGMTRQVDNDLFRDIVNVVAKLQQQQLQAQAKLKQHQQAVQQGGGSQQQQQPLPQQQLVQLQARARQLSDSLQRQAFQAYIAARLEGVEVQMPPEALDALATAWKAGNRSSSSRGGSSSSGKQRLDPLLAELEWMIQEMRVKGRVGTRSKLDKLLAVDVELVASGQRLVALQLLPEAELDSMGSKLASVQWEEDVLRRNGYDEVFWLHVADYKRVPKASRVRFIADLLRKLGVNPQERLVLAAEKAWVEAGCKPAGSSASGGRQAGGGGSWGGRVGEGDISAAEADILMRDGGGNGGGWQSGGKGGRGRRAFPKRR